MDFFSHNGRHPNSVGSASSVKYLGKEEKKSNGKRPSKVVRLSTDPQSVAARERRHRISDRFKILQSMVPGGTKMDTVSMLEEAIHYVKFLKAQIWLHQTMINFMDENDPSLFLPTTSTTLPAQQTSPSDLYSLDNFMAHGVNSSSVPVPFGLSNSYFQAEETKPFDGTMNY